MPTVAPHPTSHNPFKTGTLLAKQFDGILVAYATKHHDVIREGDVRCMGNGWACAFWRGYDNTPPLTIPRGTLAWACYRAGQSARLADDKRGVYVKK